MCMCGGGDGVGGVDIYWQFISNRSVRKEQSYDAALLRCLIPVVFSPTVNPQWSHQHWYESGCKISSFWLHMNECLGMAMVLVVGSRFLKGVFFFYPPFFSSFVLNIHVCIFSQALMLNLPQQMSPPEPIFGRCLTTLPFNSFPLTTKKNPVFFFSIDSPFKYNFRLLFEILSQAGQEKKHINRADGEKLKN